MEDLATNTYVEEDRRNFDEVNDSSSSNVEENPCVQPFESNKQPIQSSIYTQPVDPFFDPVKAFLHSEQPNYQHKPIKRDSS